MSMETRKVQLAGGSTYTVSLPKGWAEEHGVEAGSQLVVAPHDDGSLTVRVSDVREGRTAACARLDGGDRDPARTVGALYVAGFDEITLTGTFDPSARRAIRGAVRRFAGLTIVEESEGEVVLRCPLDPSDVSVRQTTIQLQFVALSMYREATGALTSAGADGGSAVGERDDEADRLFALVRRQFQRALTDLGEVQAMGASRSELFDYYAVARNLERVADHAEKLAAIADEASPPPERREAVEDAARRAGRVVEDATSVTLGGGDPTTAARALDDRDGLLSELEALDRALYEGGGDDVYRLGVAVDSITRVAEYGGNIADVGIQAAAREGSL
jgi:phosphate uptake regulator